MVFQRQELLHKRDTKMIDITPAIIASFRLAQPAFTNDVTWPDETVTTALCEGDVETGGKGWGTFEDVCTNFKRRGMYLYAAHYLAITYPKGASDSSQVGSSAKYATQSKTVGDESISFANGGANNLTAGDGWLASTSFGQQWLRLRKRAGMGARAV